MKLRVGHYVTRKELETNPGLFEKIKREAKEQLGIDSEYISLRDALHNKNNEIYVVNNEEFIGSSFTTCENDGFKVFHLDIEKFMKYPILFRGWKIDPISDYTVNGYIIRSPIDYSGGTVGRTNTAIFEDTDNLVEKLLYEIIDSGGLK